MSRLAVAALLALTSPAAAQLVAPDGLVAHYRALEGLALGISGMVSAWEDASGHGLDLAHASARHHPWRDRFAAAGRPAVVFDGDDCLVRADGMPTGSYTRLLAVRFDGLDHGGILLGGTDDDALRIAQGLPYLELVQGGESLLARAPLTEGAFYVIAVVYDAPSGAAALRIDGLTVAQGILPPCFDPAIGLGGSKYAGLSSEVAIAEVMIFDRVLATSELFAIEAYLSKHQVTGFPEVELERMPSDAQVLVRDASGLAACAVEGVVRTPGFEAARLRVTQGGVLVAGDAQALSYGPDGARFALSVAIEAGFHDHEVELALQRGDEHVIVAQRSNVCAGDAFLVTGQSNAVAKDWHAEALGDLQQSHWIRSFGDTKWVQGFSPPIVVYRAEHARSRHWGIASSHQAHQFATVGQWALRMASVLMQESGVPIAVVNGGVEASSIQAHVKTDVDPTDPSSLYGRLLFRAQLAEIDQGARALFYYQGEKDGKLPQMWSESFAQLIEDWRVDYPALERVYVFQIREGCNIPNDGVREAQRTLGYLYPEVSVMSTSAIPTHDICHYFAAGYQQIGDQIARMVLRDVYGVPGAAIDPPQIVRAEWETPSQDALLLWFEPADEPVLVDPGVEAHTSVDDGTLVGGVEALGGNVIRVQLAGSSLATTVTWRGHAFDGPWITNQAGVGALAFFGFPISD